MPEPYWPKHQGFALSDAHALGRIVRVGCGYHKTARFYRPADLKEIFGDIQVDDLATRMYCEKCGSPGYAQIDCLSPSIAELQTMTIRRLVRIKWERRLIWEDEKGA
jgi:hypothetical protein